VDACRIDALDRYDEARITKQPNLSDNPLEVSFFVWAYCTMDDDADAKMIITAAPPEN